MKGLGHLHRKRLVMVGRCIPPMVFSLALCLGSSAVAQERGKTLYAAQCESCHKSPQAVTTFHGGLDLQTFLGEHHADTPESAVSIAAYLKGVERAARQGTKPRTEANPSQPSRPLPTNAASTEGDPLKRTLKNLFGAANP